MKKILTAILIVGIAFGVYTYRNKIIQYVMIHFVYHDSLVVPDSNRYGRLQNWMYVQKTDNFYPNNQQDILNLFYTALDGGWEEVTFYCEEKYPTCMDDVRAITENNHTLSDINNFVATFNAYNRIFVDMNSFGRINIRFERLYTEEQKRQIETKIDTLYKQLLTSDMTTREKIRVIHDYIIDHTVYDQEHANRYMNGEQSTVSTSNLAYGPLFTGKAVCGGYTDTMALFLDKMGIPNYKISSPKHVWNLVYIDGSWKHLDLTWDDPVTSNGENLLLHTFFLISEETLKKEDTELQHDYDRHIYIEANEK